HRMGPLGAWLAGRLEAEASTVAHRLRWRGRSAPLRRAGGAGSEPSRSGGSGPGVDSWWRRHAGVGRTRNGPGITTRGGVDQSETDVRNAAFWNELCGSTLARSLGITDRTPESLRKFDEAYMALYPYLSPYVTEQDLKGKRLLEIGLGYGTLGQIIAQRGCQYHGLDIADGPVEMMRYRLALLGQEAGG